MVQWHPPDEVQDRVDAAAGFHLPRYDLVEVEARIGLEHRVHPSAVERPLAGECSGHEPEEPGQGEQRDGADYFQPPMPSHSSRAPTSTRNT